MRCLLLLALGCLAPGCVELGLAKNEPERMRYVLEVARPVSERNEPLAAGAKGRILEIRSFHGAVAYINEDFVYRRGPQIELDYYHGFLTPPTVTLSELTRHWLSNSGLFEIVQGIGTRVLPTHALEGDIYGFYADFSDPKAPKAVADMVFMLLKIDGVEVLTRKHYRVEVVTASTSPDELVSGWEQALARVFERLEADLRKHLAG